MLFALSGTSYAAASLINGSQIKPHTIAKNRLTNQAIQQLRGNRGAQRSQGPQGPTGAQGPAGPQGAQGIPGPPGLSGYVGGSGGTPTVSVAPGTEGSATTFCPAGTQVLFGGFFSQTSPSSLRAVTSTLFIGDTGLPGWEVTMANDGATAQSFHVLVRCAYVS